MPITDVIKADYNIPMATDYTLSIAARYEGRRDVRQKIYFFEVKRTFTVRL